MIVALGKTQLGHAERCWTTDSKYWPETINKTIPSNCSKTELYRWAHVFMGGRGFLRVHELEVYGCKFSYFNKVNI